MTEYQRHHQKSDRVIAAKAMIGSMILAGFLILTAWYSSKTDSGVREYGRVLEQARVEERALLRRGR